MSRDYKKKANGSGGRGRPMGVGILIGLLLGLCLALGVALYINKGPDPFLDKYSPKTSTVPGAPKEGAVSGAQGKTVEPPDVQKKGTGQAAKLEFDFYKILPGWEQAVSDRDFNRKNKEDEKEVYYLQVAAFPDPSGADNLKARLALSGIESKIQTAELPDGKIWHRVRIGPFDNQDELNASRGALRELDLDANLIKVRQQGR